MRTPLPQQHIPNVVSAPGQKASNLREDFQLLPRQFPVHTLTALEILAARQQSQCYLDKAQRGNARDMGCNYTQLPFCQSCSPPSYERHPRAARYASPGCRLGGKGSCHKRPCTCRVAQVGVHARSFHRVAKRRWQGVQVAVTQVVHASL